MPYDTQDGHLFLAASNLTRQYWLGQLWYYTDPEQAPDRSKAAAVEQLDVGVNAMRALRGGDQRRVVCGMDSGAVQIWTVNETVFECTANAVQHDDLVTSLSVTHDVERAISASQDRRVRLWNLDTLTSICSFQGHSDTVHCVDAHPTERDVFVSCAQDGRVLLWDTRKRKPASVLVSGLEGSLPTCVAWSRDGRHVAVGHECGSVTWREVQRSRDARVPCTQVHNRAITRLAFSDQRSDWLASGSEDGTAAVTCVSQDKLTPIHRETRHTDFVQGVAWRPGTCELYTCAWDGHVHRARVTGEAGHVMEHVQAQVQNMDVVETPQVAAT